jgi:hypothetical protein
MAPALPPRRFCRFRSDAPAGSALYAALPADGFCLSVFVLLRDPARPSTVVAGKLDASADWARLGALPPDRAEAAGEGWMLPSSHLQLFEDPDGAARRILNEQLGIGDGRLGPVRVLSESYGRKESGDPHWDLHFLFEGPWPAGRPLSAPAWRKLALLDLSTTSPAAFVRGHADILALAGTPARGAP